MENNNPSTTGMKEEDKAISTIAKSPSQDFITKVDNRDKLVRALEVVLLVALMVLNLFGLFSVTSIGSENKKNIEEHRFQIEANSEQSKKQLEAAAKANRARADIGLCIFSVSPTRRTPEYVKSCYDRIEKEFDIKVQRYGDGV